MRSGSPGFERWPDRVRRDPDNWEILVVKLGDEDGYAGVAILEKEDVTREHRFAGPVRKLYALEVSTSRSYRHDGELLLKAIFDSAHEAKVATLYTEVNGGERALIDLLTDFGFMNTGKRTSRGELVLAKTMRHVGGHYMLSPLRYHVLYGPPAIAPSSRMYLVPIRPRWHRQLFPDAPGESRERQLALPGMAEAKLWGNALRKAYLCHSKINQLAAGDVLLFYRSLDAHAVTAAGVVESVLRSRDPLEILSLLSGRTVYTPDDVAEMCRSVDGALAILFRHDRFLDPAWTYRKLEAQGVAKAPPRSITQVRELGAEWVREHLSKPA